MKSRLFVWSLSLLLVVTATSPCFGQSKSRTGTMTLDEIKARVVEARAKDRRLIIRFKNGETRSGTVLPVSDASFSLTHTDWFSGEGETERITYADVVSVKGRNPFVKAIKTVGSSALVTVGFAAGLPLWAAIQALSLLLTGKLYHDC